MKSVFIDGSAGTTGLRIHERLSMRADIVLKTLSESERKDQKARKAMINTSDYVFLCLPDAAAQEAALMCENENTKIIDASTAHRTAEGWSYGFPELSQEHKSSIKKSKRVSVPGCHASGFCAVVFPLVKSGILSADYPIVAHSVTGYSGGGKSMIADYENVNRSLLLDSPAQYALGGEHKHQKEMQAVCGLDKKPIFNPIVAPIYSGMVVSVPLYISLLNGVKNAEELNSFFKDFYSGSELISVQPFLNKGTESGFLYTNELAGKDSMKIFVCGNDERVLVAAQFCNLGKGASGAAVQCFNLMCGADETTGLVI